jgi:NAD(P)-dependent dehydrogenase (short-subunit alcohol dehydrogenase family)
MIEAGSGLIINITWVLDRPHGHAFYEVVKNAANELTEQLADDLRPPVTPRICAMSVMEAAGIEPAQGSHHRSIFCGSRPPTICGASKQYARRQLALASAREVAGMLA